MIVLGNGESRKNIDISKLSGTKIGCNAIHRDFFVEHLVCIDQRTLKESLSANLKLTTIWTRPEYVTSACIEVPDVPQGNQRADQPKHWGSGPYAVLIASQLDKEIHMIGFDLYSSTGLVNNMYKDTYGYSNSDSHAVDPRYWVYQISRIFLNNPDKYFIVYNNPNWVLPESWCLANVKFTTLDKLESLL